MVVRNLPVVSIADAVVVVTATHLHTDQYNRLIYTVKKFRKYTDMLFRISKEPVPFTSIPCVYGNP